MSLFERDTRKHPDPPVDTQHETEHETERDTQRAAVAGSSADADDSAAHIAELVRRTTDRQARGALPRPSAPARPSVAAQAPTPPPPVASWLAEPVEEPDTPEPAPAPLRMRRPSLRVLVAVGAVTAVLVTGALAVSRLGGSDAGPKTTTSAGPGGTGATAPTGYAVKVTDVVTDCAGHSRGRTRTSFEAQNCVRATRSLATGRVSGRPALFVVSRIQMATGEAAASVKQVLDATGTGNLNDLLREGRTFPGAPAKMPSSGYASVQTGAVVSVAEAGFIDAGSSSSSSPALRAAAAQVAALVPPNG